LTTLPLLVTVAFDTDGNGRMGIGNPRDRRSSEPAHCNKEQRGSRERRLSQVWDIIAYVCCQYLTTDRPELPNSPIPYLCTIVRTLYNG
jgi:hypothetical protein